PAGQGPGNYSCKINATSGNDGSDWLWLNITVPLDDSWTRTPAECSKAVQADKTGTVCSVTIENTGNVLLEFNITPTTLTNYTKPSETNFIVSAQQPHSFNINYNTTGATVGDENITTYNISSNGTPSYQTTTVTLNIISLPWWNSSWTYRKQIEVTEPGIGNRVNWPVDVHIDTSGNADNCTKEFRILDDENNLVPYKVYNETYSAGKCQSANIVFLVNESQSEKRTYYIYYGNPSAVNQSFSIWKDNCGVNENASSCASIYYSRKDNAAGLDSWDTTNAFGLGDPDYATYTLPWNFSYFNSTFTSTYVHDNGFIDFTDTTTDDTPSQDEFITRDMIAVIWDDYNPAPSGYGDAYYNEYVNPERSVLTWDTETDANGWRVTIQAVLYKTGDIMMRYGTVEGFEQAGHLAGISNGDSTNYFNNPHGSNYPTRFYQYSRAGNISILSEEKLILPNITSITIYNVTQLADKHSGGSLVKSSLNDTFNLFEDYDYHSEGIYRVEINVTGNASWTLSANTIVYHEGLDPDWVINTTEDIWYSNGTQNFTGGSFSGGKVTWDTSLGGSHPNGTFTFCYIVNLTGYTQSRQVHFYVNETDYTRADGLSWDEDYSTYNVTKKGYLEVNLITPPSIPGKGEAESNAGYKVGQNKTFIIRGNLTCKEGDCWNVNVSLRYNSSGSEPDKNINTSYDTPFYIVDSPAENPKSCGYMLINNNCEFNWTLNSTGELQSLWNLDLLGQSDLVDSKDTENTGIEITLVLILSLTFSEVNFGVCDPVTYGNPALLNDDLGYNISLNENSNDADALYIKGTDLEPQSIPGFGNITYKIGVGNLTWNDNENLYESTNTTRLTSDYELIRSDVPAGTNITMYYWIDIPTGQYAQGYDGMLYIMANTTRGY
ncbi:MAG: hypothetical protein DRN08_05070, partial [Thermoplasmata archaeon]